MSASTVPPDLHLVTPEASDRRSASACGSSCSVSRSPPQRSSESSQVPPTPPRRWVVRWRPTPWPPVVTTSARQALDSYRRVGRHRRCVVVPLVRVVPHTDRPVRRCRVGLSPGRHGPSLGGNPAGTSTCRTHRHDPGRGRRIAPTRASRAWASTARDSRRSPGRGPAWRSYTSRAHRSATPNRSTGRRPRPATSCSIPGHVMMYLGVDDAVIHSVERGRTVELDTIYGRRVELGPLRRPHRLNAAVPSPPSPSTVPSLQ